MRLGLGTDKPYKVSECAAFMGVSNEWIRNAITKGRRVPGGVVKLDAETLLSPSRCVYRIHEQQFFAFLRAIHWKHLPRPPAPLPETLPDEHAGVQ